MIGGRPSAQDYREERMCRISDYRREFGAFRASMCRVGVGVLLVAMLQFSVGGVHDAWGQDAGEAGASAPLSGAVGSALTAGPGAPQGSETGAVGSASPLDRASAANIKSIEFSPAIPMAKDPISVQIKFDRQFGLPPTLYYQWRIDGQIVQESSSPSINLPTKRGDVVEVTVFTEEIRDPARAATAFVKVAGSPPTIVRTREGLDEKGRYTAGYEVGHPDGDPVTVTLNRGPAGMVLDTARKEVIWTVPPGTQGDFPVELVAVDPSGGKATCSFSIRIKQEQLKETEKNVPKKP